MTTNYLNNQILTTSSSIKLHAMCLEPGVKRHIQAPDELHTGDEMICHYV